MPEDVLPEAGPLRSDVKTFVRVGKVKSRIRTTWIPHDLSFDYGPQLRRAQGTTIKLLVRTPLQSAIYRCGRSINPNHLMGSQIGLLAATTIAQQVVNHKGLGAIVSMQPRNSSA